jgi:hypothetical protein
MRSKFAMVFVSVTSMCRLCDILKRKANPRHYPVVSGNDNVLSGPSPVLFSHDTRFGRFATDGFSRVLPSYDPGEVTHDDRRYAAGAAWQGAGEQKCAASWGRSLERRFAPAVNMGTLRRSPSLK